MCSDVEVDVAFTVFAVGLCVGFVGSSVKGVGGLCVGENNGVYVGLTEGPRVGSFVGSGVGPDVGSDVVIYVGECVGLSLGTGVMSLEVVAIDKVVGDCVG